MNICSDAALAMQVALEFLAQDCPSEALTACHLALRQQHIAARSTFTLAANLIREGRHETARIALEIASQSIRVSPTILKARLDRVHGCGIPKAQSQDVPFGFQNHHLAHGGRFQ